MVFLDGRHGHAEDRSSDEDQEHDLGERFHINSICPLDYWERPLSLSALLQLRQNAALSSASDPTTEEFMKLHKGVGIGVSIALLTAVAVYAGGGGAKKTPVHGVAWYASFDD